jgi:RHS repeat-associated protein
MYDCSVQHAPLTRKFTGKERDSESGLDNFGARYMGSSLGRFMSPDPIYIEEQRMFDPQLLNLYSYVRNNPLNLTDPSGMLVDVNCTQGTIEFLPDSTHSHRILRG